MSVRPPAAGPSPARRAQVLKDLADELLHWRRVAAAAVAAAESGAAVSGRRLEDLSAPLAAAVSAGEVTDGLVAGVVGEVERLRREADEAGASVDFRASSVERSTAHVQQAVVGGRADGGRLLQLGELGNAAAGQAARQLDGCRSRCRAVTGRVRGATAMEDAVVANIAENEALGRARKAWNRGAKHLAGLRSSSRVARARDDAWGRSEEATTRLTRQVDALRAYDRPTGTPR